MKTIKNVFIILSSLVLLIKSAAPPPTPEPMSQIVPGLPKLMKEKEKTKSNLAVKRLADTQGKFLYQNSTVNVIFSSDSKTVENKLSIVAQDLPTGTCFSNWGFTSDKVNVDKLNCEIVSKSSIKSCKATYKDEGGKTSFTFSGTICNGEILNINYNYNVKESKPAVLYKQEAINIPMFAGSKFCDYKFTLPEGYTYLGSKENLFKKDSDRTYSYYGACPTETIQDVIRFSPAQASWKAKTETVVKTDSKFLNEVTFKIPKYYYHWGRTKNNYYKVSSTAENSYDVNNIKYDDLYFQVKVPAENKNKVSVTVETNFTNKLTDEFNLDLPKNYYEIDKSKIDPVIERKAKEIIQEKSDKPDYYKLGKFVNSYMTYDLSYFGDVSTAREIYDRKRGVCEHYTILYNAMLNAIGIQTLNTSGWAFEKDQTAGDKNTVGHAWTVALIDGKWKELDATWGLFDGIPAGHIIKSINANDYSYEYSTEGQKPVTLDQDLEIKMTEIIKGIETNPPDNSDSKKSDEDDDPDPDDKIIPIKSCYNSPSSVILFLLYFLYLF